MAWANVAGTLKGNSGAATSPWSVGALSSSVAANTRLVGFVVYNSAGGTPNVTNVSDDINGSWVKEVDSGAVTVGGFPERFTVWSTNSAAGTPTISVTFSGGTGGFGIGFSCAAYSGTSQSTDGTELDISKISTGTTSTMDSGTTASTTTDANELKIGAGGDQGNGSAISAGTSDTTYTARTNDSPNSNAQSIVEDADSGALGSTARATATQSGTPAYGFAVAVFKIVTTPPPPYTPGVYLLDVRRMIP